MNEKIEKVRVAELDCCPELVQTPVCDELHFRYRLPFVAALEEKKLRVPVDVILHFELVRCSGELVISDPIYSITLLPGEQVRLFTSDRHTQWSYDSESKLAYRHRTTSEESYFAAGVAEAMSDLTVNESTSASSSYEESWAEGGGGASFSFLGLEIGGGGGGGSYDSESTYRFSHSLSKHAQSASRYVAASVRAKSSTAIGEVNQRQHAEGESEAHYESSSRVFSNPNKCRAVTYLFHKINKIQHIRFNLVAVERRVNDPKVLTGASRRVPVDATGNLRVKQDFISAASSDRLDKERVARTSALERQQAVSSTAGIYRTSLYTTAAYASAPSSADRSDPTYDENTRHAALQIIDSNLKEGNILDKKTGEPNETFVKELSWSRDEILPTPGIIVKGCLDECATCEPALVKEMDLDLARKQLENELLKRQIELLEKSQEYRCCPEGLPMGDE